MHTDDTSWQRSKSHTINGQHRLGDESKLVLNSTVWIQRKTSDATSIVGIFVSDEFRFNTHQCVLSFHSRPLYDMVCHDYYCFISCYMWNFLLRSSIYYVPGSVRNMPYGSEDECVSSPVYSPHVSSETYSPAYSPSTYSPTHSPTSPCYQRTNIQCSLQNMLVTTGYY
jgi:hypothetical protein